MFRSRIRQRPRSRRSWKPSATTRLPINFVWTLLAGFLVMFMQAGFAMVETGFCRAKNAAHTMSMNFMVYPLGMFAYWVCGYALQMGGVGASRRSAAAPRS